MDNGRSMRAVKDSLPVPYGEGEESEGPRIHVTVMPLIGPPVRRLVVRIRILRSTLHNPAWTTALSDVPAFYTQCHENHSRAGLTEISR